MTTLHEEVRRRNQMQSWVLGLGFTILMTCFLLFVYKDTMSQNCYKSRQVIVAAERCIARDDCNPTMTDIERLMRYEELLARQCEGKTE